MPAIAVTFIKVGSAILCCTSGACLHISSYVSVLLTRSDKQNKQVILITQLGIIYETCSRGVFGWYWKKKLVCAILVVAEPPFVLRLVYFPASYTLSIQRKSILKSTRGISILSHKVSEQSKFYNLQRRAKALGQNIARS